MEIIQLFVLGLIILLGAIVINLAASKFRILTWYSYIQIIHKHGLLGSFKQTKFSLIFLYLIYPLLLGILSKYTHNLIF